MTPTPESVASGAVCDAGTYCGNGSSSALKCLIGFYNPNAGQESCSACPAGLYCPQNDTKVSITCPAGYFCPARSHQPVACPDASLARLGWDSLIPTGMYTQGCIVQWAQ